MNSVICASIVSYMVWTQANLTARTDSYAADENDEIHETVASCVSPRRARQMGRTISGFRSNRNGRSHALAVVALFCVLPGWYKLPEHSCRYLDRLLFVHRIFTSSPACTELEPIVLDWLAKAIGLPKIFIYDGKGPGCGVIQGSASEATIMTLLAARTKTLRKLEVKYPGQSQHMLLSKLVAYTSEYSHSSVERACLVAMVKLNKVLVDENIAMRGAALQAAMDKDRKDGMIPFYVCATLGTTDCASFDNIAEIGQVCDDEVWLHVDAAYAGGSFICPEYRHFMKGVEMVTSFNFNPSKSLMVNFDFSALWVKNSVDLINSFKVDPVFLRHDNQATTIDYRHWQLPLGRRFRSLKLWFVMRIFGLENMRKRIREDAQHAKTFEKLVRTDDRFEICFPVHLGLVCFRLVVAGECDNEKINKINQDLLNRIVDSKDIYIVGSRVRQRFHLRLVTGSVGCDEKAVKFAWKTIQRHACSVLRENK